MNWEAAGAIGEIVGAVAVVATLLYLAKQTKTNTDAVIAASTRASSWGFAEFNERIATHPDLTYLLTKSFDSDMPDFTPEEWARFQFLARSEVGRIQETFLQARTGFQDQGLAESQLDFMRSLLEYPAWRTFWDDEGGTWTTDFISDIESRRPMHIGNTSLDKIERGHTDGV